MQKMNIAAILAAMFGGDGLFNPFGGKFTISQGTYEPTLERVPLCYRPNRCKPKKAINNWKYTHRLCAERRAAQ